MTYPQYPTSPNDPQGGQGWQQPGQPYMSPEQARQAWAQQTWTQQQYPGQQQYPTGPGGPPPPWGSPPGYGQPTPPPQPPQRKFGWGARIGAGVLGLFLFGSCMNAIGSREPRATNTADTTPTQQQAAAPAAPAAPVVPVVPAQPAAPAFPGAQPGDIVTSSSGNVTINGVTIIAAPLTPGDATFGSTLCTTVVYANDSGDQVSYGIFDWSMQNPAGAIVNITFFGGDDAHLGSGELASGGSTQGTVCFEDENASSGDYVLLYDRPSFFSSERAAWINPR